MDVILTSFNRLDLLQVTLDSFFKYNTYPITSFTIYDDYGWDNMTDEQKDKFNSFADNYPKIDWICGSKRVGQIVAIDTLVSSVKTPYYFHLEDDWEFLQPDFIQDSLEVLEQHPKIIQCWLRGINDTNGHPIIQYNGLFSYMSTKYEWKGFSFNPAVRRLVDYTLYNDICPFNPKDPAHSEKIIGNYYHKKGFRACILNRAYVKHVGNNRTCK